MVIWPAKPTPPRSSARCTRSSTDRSTSRCATPRTGSWPGPRPFATTKIDGTDGVYLFRYNVTGLPESLKDLEPGDLTDRLMTATIGRSGTLFPAPVTAEGAAAHAGFQGLQGPTERTFGYTGGYVQGQAGMDPRDGAVFVTLVFGPQDAFVGTSGSPGDLAAVVQSIGEYRPA